MKKLLPLFLVAIMAAVSFGAQAAGYDVQGFAAAHADVVAGLSMLCVGNMEVLMKSMDSIEKNLQAQAEKAEGQFKTLGKTSDDTKTAIDTLGTTQRELADRLLQLEQKTPAPVEVTKSMSWGEQFVKSSAYTDRQGLLKDNLRVGNIGFEVKNTLTGSDTNVAPDRKPGVVAGAYLPFSMEALLPSTITNSNAIEFTREASFTNSSAEAAEGAQKAESALTWSLVNMPISTVAHWIKISKQLASDNTALAAYVNSRMVYGVNQKVDTQLVVGSGVSPNISGTFIAANYTAHGYTAANITAFPAATLKRFALIRKVIGDLYASGFPATAVVLNPADWASMEIELMTVAAGQTLYSVDAGGTPRLFGLPVVQSIGLTAGNFQVGAFSEAYMIYNREGVTIEMSDSDSDNFTKNLLTLRAERRLALATEKPAAVRGGLLSPA